MLFRSILSFICLFFVLNIQSQTTSFGVHAISNYSSFKEPESKVLKGDLFEYKFGYGIGGSVTRNIGKHFDVLAELNFERKGTKYGFNFTDENGNPTSGKPSLRLDYISLPLLIQMKFGENITFNFQIGTAFNFLVNSTLKMDLVGESNVLFPEVDDIKDFNRFDQSVLGGVGLAAPLNDKLNFYINSRFNYGLAEVTKKESFYADKNLAYMLMAGVQF